MSCCGRQRNIQETYNHMLENDYTAPKYDPDAVGPKIFDECKKTISSNIDNCRELIDSCCESGCQQQATAYSGPNSYEVCVEQCGGESFGYCPDIPQPEPVDPNDKHKKPKKPPVPIPIPGGDKKPASKAEQQTFFKTTGGKVTIGVLVALLVLVLVLIFSRMRK